MKLDRFAPRRKRRRRRVLLTAVVALAIAVLGVVGGASAASAAAVTPGPGTITTGAAFACSLTGAGGVKCWGDNGEGELGDGTTSKRLTPVDVDGLTSGITAITAGSDHTCALTDAGGVKCWGHNEAGELGDGTRTNRLTPVDVVGLSSGVVTVDAGFRRTCVVTTTGGAKCWGQMVGDGASDDHLTPVGVPGLTSGVAAISAAAFHTCALTTAGGVKCWGMSVGGQLGDGTEQDHLSPVDVVGLPADIVAISAGSQHTCALTSAGGAKCWGDNTVGQLGDGTTTKRLTPVDVAGLSSGVSAIAAGGGNSCALMTGGGLKCWGANGSGGVGDGTTIDRTRPVDVFGLTADVAAVDTGSEFEVTSTCAVTTAGAVTCWGGGGGVGDGTTDARDRPVDVSGSFYRPECPSLVAAAGSTFTTSDGLAAGSVATFTAEPLFALTGEPTLHCRADTTWDGSPPTTQAFPILDGGHGAVTEGDTGTTDLNITATLTAPFALPVTADWRTLYVPPRPDGTPRLADEANPLQDYIGASGTVTFAPGETTATVTIKVRGDFSIEPREVLLVAFSKPTNAVLRPNSWGLGAGFIDNDDTTAPALLTPTTAATLEGDTGSTTVEATTILTTTSSRPITVDWRTIVVAGFDGPQADPGTDYTPASGTLTIPAGENTGTVTITLHGDTDIEPDEGIFISFSNATNAVVRPETWGIGGISITNDD